ncbi:MAG: Appr-1-p processing protein [Psychrobacillus sp.]
MIKIVEGDLLSITYGIIGHQVNCQGVMGSGVAEQVKGRYPLAFKEYKDLVDEYNQDEDLRHTLLGHVNGVAVDKDLYIANMFGQKKYGYDGGVYTNTNALYQCFKTVRKVAESLGLPVYLPYMIGCYRGGADWKEVENLLLKAFDGYEVTLMKYNKG